MKKNLRITALLLAVWISLGSAAGCSKKETAADSTDAGQTEVKDGLGEGVEAGKSTVLTGVYRGTALPLDGNESPVTGVKPYFDKDSGEITFITSCGECVQTTD